MITIPIYLDPHGNPDRRQELGTIQIYNDATGTSSLGNYGVRILGKHGRVIRTAEVKGYARLARPVFDLVLQALRAAGYK